MRNILIMSIGVALMFTLGGCVKKDTQEAAPKVTTIQTIKDRGVIRIGVKGDTYKFGYKDPHTGIIDGFDVDVAKALAKRILGDEKKLKTVAVTTASRILMIDNDELDYVIATFTITEERKNKFNFSNPYFVDSGIGMMVKKDSNIFSMKDLHNKRVGVAANTTAVKSMQDAATKAGIKINLVEYDIYPSVKAALNADDVDCFATNGIILLSYMDDGVKLLDDRLAPQSYGIVSKKGNNELTQVANEVIETLNKSGEINNIISKWGLQ